MQAALSRRRAACMPSISGIVKRNAGFLQIMASPAQQKARRHLDITLRVLDESNEAGAQSRSAAMNLSAAALPCRADDLRSVCRTVTSSTDYMSRILVACLEQHVHAQLQRSRSRELLLPRWKVIESCYGHFWLDRVGNMRSPTIQRQLFSQLAHDFTM